MPKVEALAVIVEANKTCLEEPRIVHTRLVTVSQPRSATLKAYV